MPLVHLLLDVDLLTRGLERHQVVHPLLWCSSSINSVKTQVTAQAASSAEAHSHQHTHTYAHSIRWAILPSCRAAALPHRRTAKKRVIACRPTSLITALHTTQKCNKASKQVNKQAYLQDAAVISQGQHCIRPQRQPTTPRTCMHHSGHTHNTCLML